MPTKPIVKMGNRELATPSSPVENFSTQALYDLIQDMRDTQQEKGGVGLAAPQIGYNKRIIVFGFDYNERYPNEKSVPLTILVNPVIEFFSDEQGRPRSKSKSCTSVINFVKTQSQQCL